MNITADFFSYDDIPLKVFTRINATGDFKLLIKSGVATADVCAEHWEQIIKDNSKVTGRGEYTSYQKTLRAYNKLLRDFTQVKSHLVILCYTLDFEAIQFIRSKGYNIDTSNSEKYAASIHAAIRKSDNILTKLQMKKNELLATTKENPGREVESFESIMAALTFQLGYTVADDITLTRYNEYLKLIDRKQKAIRAQKEKYGRT